MLLGTIQSFVTRMVRIRLVHIASISDSMSKGTWKPRRIHQKLLRHPKEIHILQY